MHTAPITTSIISTQSSASPKPQSDNLTEPITPRCAVGLLTWNGERDVLECVRSILGQTEQSLEICWVDNASSDSTVAWVKREFPSFPAPMIMSSNIGFCAGHNVAFAQTKAPYYLALNQ